MSNLVDLSDETFLDALSMRMVERKLKERQSKRHRPRSSTDDEAMLDEDVSLDMLNDVKKEFEAALKSATQKLEERLDSAYGKIDGMTKKIEKNKKEITNNHSTTENMKTELDLLRRNTKESIDELKNKTAQQKKDLKASNDEVKRLAAETAQLKAEQKKNTRRLIDLEARSRRNNLIFYGIEETHDENCADKIIKLLKDHLQINTIASNQLQRAHRLGTPKRQTHVGSKANKPRPIIVCFLDFNLKETIRTRRHQLKNTMHSISEDLPVEIRSARRSLDKLFKELKDQGHRVGFAYPCRLIKNGEVVENIDPANFA